MQNELATRWVKDFGDMLYRYALPRVSDSAIAKDLVQETFLAAWRNVDNYKGEASEKNWLFTILKNKIIDHYRKASSRLTDNIDISEGENSFDENGHWTATTKPNDWGIDYNTAIEQKEFYSVLEICKSKLKQIQNAVFSMKYLDGVDSDEICKELNITSANYWVLLHRAKLQLRGCLEKNWFVK